MKQDKFTPSKSQIRPVNGQQSNWTLVKTYNTSSFQLILSHYGAHFIKIMGTKSNRTDLLIAKPYLGTPISCTILPFYFFMYVFLTPPALPGAPELGSIWPSLHFKFPRIETPRRLRTLQAQFIFKILDLSVASLNIIFNKSKGKIYRQSPVKTPDIKTSE